MPRETSPDLHVPDSPDLHGVASVPVDEAREARPLLSSAFQVVVEKLVHLHVKDKGHMVTWPFRDLRGRGGSPALVLKQSIAILSPRSSSCGYFSA